MDEALKAAEAAIRPLREMGANTGRLAYTAIKAALPHIELALRAADDEWRPPEEEPGELVRFFREEEVEWGHKGDYEDWSTERAAIELIRVLRAGPAPSPQPNPWAQVIDRRQPASSEPTEEMAEVCESVLLNANSYSLSGISRETILEALRAAMQTGQRQARAAYGKHRPGCRFLAVGSDGSCDCGGVRAESAPSEPQPSPDDPLMDLFVEIGAWDDADKKPALSADQRGSLATWLVGVGIYRSGSALPATEAALRPDGPLPAAFEAELDRLEGAFREAAHWNSRVGVPAKARAHRNAIEALVRAALAGAPPFEEGEPR